MASYGFVTSGSAGGTNRDQEWMDADPYANTQSTGYEGQPPTATQQYDPYAGSGSAFQSPGTLQGGLTNMSPPSYVPQQYTGPYSGTQGDPYAGTQSTGGQEPNFQTYQPQTYTGQYTPWRPPEQSQYPSPTWPNMVSPPTGANFDLGALGDPRTASAWNTYAQAVLPLQQSMNNQRMQQNEFDFNSWLRSQELGLTQAQYEATAGIENRGMTLQERLAQEAANQWNANFSREGNQWNQEFAREGQQWGQEYDLRNRNLALETELGRGQLGIQNAENRIQEAYNTGRLLNEGESLRIEEELGMERNRIQEAYNTGQLSIDDYVARMNRIAQTENLALNYAEIGSRETISREQMENAYRTAVMNAVGRNQAQNIRFLRG